MAKPPAGSKKPTKPKAPKDERPQIERFKETARSIGVDETGQEFLDNLRKIMGARRRHD